MLYGLGPAVSTRMFRRSSRCGITFLVDHDYPYNNIIDLLDVTNFAAMSIQGVSGSIRAGGRYLPIPRYAMARSMRTSAATKASQAAHQQGVAGPSNPNTSSKSGNGRIPIIRTLEGMRRWRRSAREQKLDVGIVPTVSQSMRYLSGQVGSCMW